jgi:phosphate-selective porin
MPKKNFRLNKNNRDSGAFELGMRYTYSDLQKGSINGGTFGIYTGAISWFPNAHFRYEINYGNGSLHKDNLKGNANFWQFRAQFEL